MLGFLFSILAGAAMSFQGVMNTRLQEKLGLWEANTFVQGTAFLLSIAAMWLFGSGSWAALPAVPKAYLFGGVLGLVITVTVMLSIRGLSPTIAVATILIAQLTMAAVIDGFGLMGQEKTAFGIRQWIGFALMTGGLLCMKWKTL